MYMERDLRKATPLKENPSQSAHLSQCLDLLIVYLSTTPAVILGTRTDSLPARVDLPPLVDLVKARNLLLLFFSPRAVFLCGVCVGFFVVVVVVAQFAVQRQLFNLQPSFTFTLDESRVLEFPACVCQLYFQVVENTGCINCKSAFSELSFTLPLIFSPAFCFIPCFVPRQCPGCTPGREWKEAPVCSSEQTAEADLAHIGYSAGASFVKGTLAWQDSFCHQGQCQ